MPSSVEPFRNIVSVKSNVVTMPIVSEASDSVLFEEVSIFQPRAKIDRGPDDAYKSSCEIQTLDRSMTLYSDDAQLVNKITYYLQRVIELRDKAQVHLRN